LNSLPATEAPCLISFKRELSFLPCPPPPVGPHQLRPSEGQGCAGMGKYLGRSKQVRMAWPKRPTLVNKE
jgi:hypothetical protein